MKTTARRCFSPTWSMPRAKSTTSRWLSAQWAEAGELYEIGLGHPPDQVGAVWRRAMGNLIPPRTVDNAPCQEVIIEGAALDKPGSGLDALPVPISTPGWDNSPYLTTSAFITKDPDTGVQNIGNYRAQVKSPRRLGMNPSVELKAGGYLHWLKYKALGKPMPTAVVVGLPPAVAYASVQKAPETIDEISLPAAWSVHRSISSKRVPSTSWFRRRPKSSSKLTSISEAPFGELHRHVNLAEYNGFMNVTCITRKQECHFYDFPVAARTKRSDHNAPTRSGSDLPAPFTRSDRHQGYIPCPHAHAADRRLWCACVAIRAGNAANGSLARALCERHHPASGRKFVIAINDDIDPKMPM